MPSGRPRARKGYRFCVSCFVSPSSSRKSGNSISMRLILGETCAPEGCFLWGWTISWVIPHHHHGTPFFYSCCCMCPCENVALSSVITFGAAREHDTCLFFIKSFRRHSPHNVSGTRKYMGSSIMGSSGCSEIITHPNCWSAVLTAYSPPWTICRCSTVFSTSVTCRGGQVVCMRGSADRGDALRCCSALGTECRGRESSHQRTGWAALGGRVSGRFAEGARKAGGGRVGGAQFSCVGCVYLCVCMGVFVQQWHGSIRWVSFCSRFPSRYVTITFRDRASSLHHRM